MSKLAVGVLVGIALIGSLTACDSPSVSSTRTEQASTKTEATSQPSDAEATNQPTADPSASETATTLEADNTKARLSSVLAGKYVCTNTAAVRPTCVATGESRYASPGSQILLVDTEVRNRATDRQDVSLGRLVVNYLGKTLYYSPMEDSGVLEAQIEPLGRKKLSGAYDVPEEVLDVGMFKFELNDSQLPLDFERPAAVKQMQAQARADDGQRDAVRKAEEREANAKHDKCWALNDSSTPLVSEQDYGWYVDNCSEMFQVLDYEGYVRMHSAHQE